MATFSREKAMKDSRKFTGTTGDISAKPRKVTEAQIYTGRTYPMGKGAQKNSEHYQPQMPEDKHGPGYENDCKGYVRGAGGDATKDRPGGFDRLPSKGGHSIPTPSKGGKSNATGDDRQRSPWSAAHNTYKE